MMKMSTNPTCQFKSSSATALHAYSNRIQTTLASQERAAGVKRIKMDKRH